MCMPAVQPRLWVHGARACSLAMTDQRVSSVATQQADPLPSGCRNRGAVTAAPLGFRLQPPCASGLHSHSATHPAAAHPASAPCNPAEHQTPLLTLPQGHGRPSPSLACQGCLPAEAAGKLLPGLRGLGRGPAWRFAAELLGRRQPRQACWAKTKFWEPLSDWRGHSLDPTGDRQGGDSQGLLPEMETGKESPTGHHAGTRPPSSELTPEAAPKISTLYLKTGHHEGSSRQVAHGGHGPQSTGPGVEWPGKVVPRQVGGRAKGSA